MATHKKISTFSYQLSNPQQQVTIDVIVGHAQPSTSTCYLNYVQFDKFNNSKKGIKVGNKDLHPGDILKVQTAVSDIPQNPDIASITYILNGGTKQVIKTLEYPGAGEPMAGNDIVIYDTDFIFYI